MSGPTPSASSKPHRFYKAVDVAPVEFGHAVRLDGRVAKTPGGGRLILPTPALAARIAAEWDRQEGYVDTGAMPATRLAFTAIDHAPGARDGLADEAARYAGSDLLCYFAEAPRELSERQSRLWGPWLDWAERELGLCLIRAAGIAPQRQPPESLARVSVLAAAMDDFALSGLVFATGLFGSAVLALAVARGAMSGEAAFELSRLDEAFQEERWGVDAEAATRTARLRDEAEMVGGWFADLGA